MTWETSTTWWIVAGVLVAAELGTGTFYLLMLAIGAVAGAGAAHLGLGTTSQVVAAAVVGAGATAAWHFFGRPRHRTHTEANRDVNLDVGERVHVAAWNDDGTARVPYPGAAWNVRHAGPHAPRPGLHVIAEVRHNELLLRPLD
jgi:membrane protein implicated in regulation of membrane protease activity